MRSAPTCAVAVALAFALTACSGDASDPPAEPTSPGAADAPKALVTTARMGKVTGRLPQEKRSNVRKQVAKAVDAWFDAAYVGGDYPRNDFSSAWPGFTAGAKADARADKAQMSNQDIGRRVESVEATARKVVVDVLAVNGHVAGATARVLLRFRTEGEVRRKVEVQGRLFLTPTSEGWRIFGYDVAKGRGA